MGSLFSHSLWPWEKCGRLRREPVRMTVRSRSWVMAWPLLLRHQGQPGMWESPPLCVSRIGLEWCFCYVGFLDRRFVGLPDDCCPVIDFAFSERCLEVTSETCLGRVAFPLSLHVVFISTRFELFSSFVDEKGGLHFPRYFITVLCGIPDSVIIPFISS